jgi:hypothetical protein
VQPSEMRDRLTKTVRDEIMGSGTVEEMLDKLTEYQAANSASQTLPEEETTALVLDQLQVSPDCWHGATPLELSPQEKSPEVYRAAIRTQRPVY